MSDARARLDGAAADDAPGAGTGRRNRHSTVAKVVTLLEAMAAREEGISVRELGREAGIDKSAISRLFEQLVELGVAEQDEFSGRFRVGPALFSLAATIHGHDTLWRAAEPILRELATAFNETCYLAVRDGDEIIFRDKVDCTHKVRYVIDPGERAPLHAGAGGRAVLMALSDDEVHEILKRTGLPAVTPRTVTDPDKLFALLHADRKRRAAASGCPPGALSPPRTSTPAAGASDRSSSPAPISGTTRPRSRRSRPPSCARATSFPGAWGTATRLARSDRELPARFPGHGADGGSALRAGSPGAEPVFPRTERGYCRSGSLNVSGTRSVAPKVSRSTAIR